MLSTNFSLNINEGKYTNGERFATPKTKDGNMCVKNTPIKILDWHNVGPMFILISETASILGSGQIRSIQMLNLFRGQNCSQNAAFKL